MSQVRLAAISSAALLRMTIAAVLASGLVAFGFTATAAADEVNSCSKMSVSVVCVGEINDNPVTVNVGDIYTASNNSLSALNTQLDSVFVAVGNISDINALAADLTTTVQTAVNTWLATAVNTFTTVINTVTNTVTTVSNVTTNTITKTCSVLVPPATTGPNDIVVGCS